MQTLALALTLSAPIPYEMKFPTIDGVWCCTSDDPPKCLSGTLTIKDNSIHNGREYLQFKYGPQHNTLTVGAETWKYTRVGDKFTLTRNDKTFEFSRQY